jgi:hypothetical protein
VSEQEIKVDIELLKKDVTTMSALLSKFDTTIDKMQEIASSLSRMVSLQEQRLETQERTTSEMQSILEMRRQEHNNNIKDVYNRINTVNKELTDKIEDTEKAILSELKALRDEIKKEDTTIASRLGQIETWKYGIDLVVIVVAWFAGQANLIDNILK